MQALQPTSKPVFSALYRNPAALTTLADLDENEDLEPLNDLVYSLCGPYCKSIEFSDDNYRKGHRALYYEVCVPVANGRVDRSEDGAYADTDDYYETVSVPVTPGMTLGFIASRMESEVKGIEGNCFAD